MSYSTNTKQHFTCAMKRISRIVQTTLLTNAPTQSIWLSPPQTGITGPWEQHQNNENRRKIILCYDMKGDWVPETWDPNLFNGLSGKPHHLYPRASARIGK